MAEPLGVPALFLLPALFFIAIWLIWPTIFTVRRSLYSNSGDEFVGLDNYETMFNDEIIFTAIKNNALWVLIVPAAVTAVGLVFAVLTERVWWATAFKIAVFIPLAVSLFAVGVIWRIMYERDPDQGAINAMIVGVQEAFEDSGVLSRARPSTEGVTGSVDQGFTVQKQVASGGTVTIGLTAVPATEVPENAPDAKPPEPVEGGISGIGVARLQAGRRHAGRGRGGRDGPRRRHASRSSTPEATRSRRPRPTPTAASSSTTSNPASSTGSRSTRSRSRPRSPASTGWARS